MTVHVKHVKAIVNGLTMAPASAGLLDVFFFSSRRRHTRLQGDWSSDVCSSDLIWVWLLFDDFPAARGIKAALLLLQVEVPVVVQVATEVEGTQPDHGLRPRQAPEIGRASCRERV